MSKLGRNHGGYRGETIHLPTVLSDLSVAAARAGWTHEAIRAEDGIELAAWKRIQAERIQAGSAQPHRTAVYLSGGIHGDEPAGPLALQQLIEADSWPNHLDLWLCPCLNPTGFPLNRRENAAGLDLNRQYLHPEAPETRAHVAWLQQQPDFDLALCLHEDWESNGFYLYEINRSTHASHSEAMIQEVSRVCPIDLSPEIEGRPASRGIIHPNPDPASRPQWPEAFWLLTHKTRHSYTLEAPSDFELPVRVNALVAAVRAALERL